MIPQAPECPEKFGRKHGFMVTFDRIASYVIRILGQNVGCISHSHSYLRCACPKRMGDPAAQHRSRQSFFRCSDQHRGSPRSVVASTRSGNCSMQNDVAAFETRISTGLWSLPGKCAHARPSWCHPEHTPLDHTFKDTNTAEHVRLLYFSSLSST